MEDYHQAEQDLLFGVLDALPCPAALLNGKGQPAYVNPKGDACGLPMFNIGACKLVCDCLDGRTPPAGWVTLRTLDENEPDGAPKTATERLSGLAEAYPVRVDDKQLGALFLLRPEVGSSEDYDGLPYISVAMQSLRARLSRLCVLGVPALFLGEEGTGRGAFARALHNMSLPGENFLTVACRTDDEQMLEQELFGDIPHPGALRALAGTVFLRDVDALPPAFQRRLLALLQNRVFPDGMPFLARLSACGPPDLENMAEEGNINAGLFARLSVMPVKVPPLRERAEDILPLARHFLQLYAALTDSPATDFSTEACSLLQSHMWLGNVKMLEDTVVASLARCTGEYIKPEHLLIDVMGIKPDLHEQRQGFTKRRVEEALALYGRSVEGKRRAAKELGIGLSTLYRLLGEKKS